MDLCRQSGQTTQEDERWGTSLGLVQETIEKTLKDRNWDFYRDHYLNGDYSFQELVRLNNSWYVALEENRVFYHQKWINKFLGKLSAEFPVRVVELGCYRGELAAEILPKYDDIVSWDGYDICHYAVDFSACNDKRYFPTKLTCSFWQLPDFKFEIFVSAHTIEHLSNEEAIDLMGFLERNCRKGIYLEMPIKEEGKKWRGGASSHVLELGRKHFRRFFHSHGWKTVHEATYGMDWSIGLAR
jgi:hypothetical protein